MKRWMIYLLLVAGAFLFPKRPVELGKLIPVELVVVEKSEGLYRIRTDTGDMGQGDTLRAAIDNLRSAAPGNLFLDTAQYLAITEDALGAIPDLPRYLKGGTRLCVTDFGMDAERAAIFLRAHPPKLRLKDWKTGIKPAYLQQIGEGLLLQ